MSIDVALPRATSFSVGRVFRDSFGILVRNIVIFGTIALAARLVVLLASPIAALVPTGAADLAANWITVGLDLVASGLTEAAIVFAAFQCLRGQHATAAHVVRGLRCATPMVVAGLIYGIPLHATDLVEQVFGEGLLGVLLSLVVVVAAIVLTVTWWIYTPAIAIEGKGIFASFTRSAQLTKGRRWSIFGLFLLVTIAMIAPPIVFVAVTDWSLSDVIAEGPRTVLGAIAYAYYALGTAFYTVLVTVAYYYLRIEKEGSGVEDVVGVFD
jgi:hypothetical protein